MSLPTLSTVRRVLYSVLLGGDFFFFFAPPVLGPFSFLNDMIRRITHDHCSIVEFFKGVDLEIVRKVGLRETWVSCLAWGPWKRVRGGDEGDNNKSKAFLAYGFRGKVYICPITVSLESGDYSRPPGDHDPSRLSAVAGNRLVVGSSMSDVHLVSAIAWAEEVRFFALHTPHHCHYHTPALAHNRELIR